MVAARCHRGIRIRDGRDFCLARRQRPYLELAGQNRLPQQYFENWEKKVVI